VKELPGGTMALLDERRARPVQQLRELREQTEQYCVILQTLIQPPNVESKWIGI